MRKPNRAAVLLLTLLLCAGSGCAPTCDVAGAGSGVPVGHQDNSGGSRGGFKFLFAAATDGTGRQGAIFRSTDSGKTWQSVAGTPPPTLTCFAANDTYVFAPTVQGLLRSADDGVTWSNTALLSGNEVLGVTAVGGYVIAATDYGIWRSTNNGDSWTRVYDPGYGNFATNGRDILASNPGLGVIYSRDTGRTWTEVASTIQTREVNGVVFDSIYMYAGTYQYGIYRSSNRGSTWQQMPLTSYPYFYGLATMGDTLFAASDRGLLRSTDFGYFWTPLGFNNSYTQSVLAISRPYIFVGTFGYGVSMTSDQGKTWSTLDTGLTYNVVYGLGMK
ncbi:MAG: hypothetical protein Q8922_09400 [Bacteroidota bacterium]|nr:hypothetical protein [Bacteroidota bacterium]MDP4288139.1 hypothetical protein [Bacteroidota bacterium]